MPGRRIITDFRFAAHPATRAGRICAGLFAAAAFVAIGYASARALPDGADPLVPVTLLIAGIGIGAFALILAAAVWLVTRPG